MSKLHGSKKTLFTVVVVIASLLAVAVILFGIILSINIYQLITDTVEIKTFEINENFDSIMIEGYDYNVEILPTTDDLCTVDAPVSASFPCTVEVSGGTLKINRTDNRSRFSKMGFIFEDYNISVWLPQKDYNCLDIKTVSGDINTPSSANTKIYSNNISFKNIKTESVSGDIGIGNVNVTDSVKAKTVSGDVKLDCCDASAIYINTTSGDVKGSVTKDLSFGTKTTSGDVNVPESGKDGQCVVRTASGDIIIKKAS